MMALINIDIELANLGLTDDEIRRCRFHYLVAQLLREENSFLSTFPPAELKKCLTKKKKN